MVEGVLEREKLTSDSHGARCLSERSFGSQADSQASFQSSSPFLEVGLEEIGRRRVVVVGCERVVRIEDGNLRNGFIILVIGFSKDLEEVRGGLEVRESEGLGSGHIVDQSG